MTHWRRELLWVAEVLILPAIMLAIFPYGALRFQGNAARLRSEPSAAIIELTAAEEARIIAEAKSTWRSRSPGELRVRSRLALGELPPINRGAALVSGVTTEIDLPTVRYGFPPLKPSMAASSPVKIEGEIQPPSALTFTREDLLKID